MTPHPMVLWLTAFYNKLEGPRWLPCYLDLKNDQAQKNAVGTNGFSAISNSIFFQKKPRTDVCMLGRSMLPKIKESYFKNGPPSQKAILLWVARMIAKSSSNGS